VPTLPLIRWLPGISGWWSGRGVALTTHPHQVPMIHLQFSYASTPLWALLACWRVNCLSSAVDITTPVPALGYSAQYKIILKLNTKQHSRAVKKFKCWLFSRGHTIQLVPVFAFQLVNSSTSCSSTLFELTIMLKNIKWIPYSNVLCSAAPVSYVTRSSRKYGKGSLVCDRNMKLLKVQKVHSMQFIESFEINETLIVFGLGWRN
jgi:hypothetical protein